MSNQRRPQNNTNDSIDSLLTRIAALEATYAVQYYASANTTGTTTTPFVFDTKVHDDHNLVTQSPWRFTATVAGIYQVSGSIRFSTTGQVNVYKNGVSLSYIAYDPGAFEYTGSVDVAMVPGDYLDLRPSTGSITLAGGTQAGLTAAINIKKVG